MLNYTSKKSKKFQFVCLIWTSCKKFKYLGNKWNQIFQLAATMLAATTTGDVYVKESRETREHSLYSSGLENY